MREINKKSRNVYYSMVSNGTITSKNRISVLSNLGLRDFLITLDGPKEIHDMFRKSEQGRGSFDRIITNLKFLQQNFPEIRVSINCNLNIENKDHVEELLDYLNTSGIKYPVIFSLVIDTAKKNFEATIRNVDVTWRRAHEAAIARGHRFEPFYRDIFLGCSMFQKNNFTIGADGFLYSCIEAVGVDSYRMASTYDYGNEIFETECSQVSEQMPISDKCRACKFLPVCGGGCYYKRQSGTFECPYTELEMNDVPLTKYARGAYNG